MALSTRSSFFYGFTVTQGNNKLDFDEGSGELQATLKIGDYSMTTFLAEVKRAMEAVGTNDYTVTVDRATRIVTIAGSASFELLAASGTRIGQGPWTLLGYTADSGVGTSHDGDTVAGSSYQPQFKLQDYVEPDHWKRAVKAVVNESASGALEVVKFGNVRMTQFNIKYATDKAQAVGSPIENSATGVDDLRDFMTFAITKGLVEFMPDRDDGSTFFTVRLERTPDDGKGVSYKLRELYTQDLPFYFETGVLVWRVIE